MRHLFMAAAAAVVIAAPAKAAIIMFSGGGVSRGHDVGYEYKDYQPVDGALSSFRFIIDTNAPQPDNWRTKLSISGDTITFSPTLYRDETTLAGTYVFNPGALQGLIDGWVETAGARGSFLIEHTTFRQGTTLVRRGSGWLEAKRLPDDYAGWFGPSITPGSSGAVPEPASWAMMIAGFGLLGGAMRRRPRHATS